ncbi:Na+/H+ antiporter [Actinomycetospora sp. TBRC 11914]|uniref:Na+/H+ antiporter n=1 Tax=Actinomycetospora sp. TBRC 11914 TaxID=2729387 RepID=UPI00145D316B|nr:Na+/H+ antiporter [Actinomycetospora sp. TBRC 11914]NMO88499.1 Na+/H+ antiporter [Actinomycetospora sp. TBRC 11914]
MIAVVAGIVALVIVTALVRAGARRTGVPDPIALLVVGIGLSWVPGLPQYHIDPDLVLVVVLPVLLYCAAFAASVPAFRIHLRPILLLSVGLTIVTALAVGGVAEVLVPGLGFAAACALGAVVAPPDAVAATAVARTIRLPRRVVALLEGESLFNDAAALTVLTVAVGAVAGDTLSFPQAVGRFLVVSVGGLVAGAVAALVIGWVRQRVTHPYTDVVVFLVAPFVSYLPAEELGASGLAAVVVSGLYLGHRATTIMEPGARVVTGAVRTAVSWLLEGMVFLVVGLQLRQVVVGISGMAPGVVAGVTLAVVGTVVAVRFAWVVLAEQGLATLLRRRHASWTETTLTAWSGMRGAVSLAAVLTLPVALPDGRAFPQRDLVVFVTFVVILATLLGQGVTLPALARRLPGTHGEAVEEAQEEARARRLAADAALECLEQLEREEPGRRQVVEQLRRRVQNRIEAATEAEEAAEAQADAAGPGSADADGGEPGEAAPETPEHELPDPEAAGRGGTTESVAAPASHDDEGDGAHESTRESYRRYGQAMLVAERSRLLALRNAGTLGEDAFVRIQHELDLEQAAMIVR